MSYSFETFKWAVTAASIYGVVLNIHHRKSCFIVWGATNAAWVAIDVIHGVYPQAALQAIYCGLSVYGWVSWKRKEI